jgi:hypothetical protein
MTPTPDTMNITPKFKINDIIKLKHSRDWDPDDSFREAVRYEVIYIATETCSAGTQIFYSCRPMQVTESAYRSNDKVGTSSQVKVMDAVDFLRTRYREDEVVPCDPVTLAIIKG